MGLFLETEERKYNVLKNIVFPLVFTRIEKRKDSLIHIGTFVARGLEGWLKVEIVAALADSPYPVEDIRNKGIDLLLKGGIDLELKGQTNFVLSEIKKGVKYGTPCLFLANARNKRTIKKLEDDETIEILSFKIFSDSRNEWIIGLIKPS